MKKFLLFVLALGVGVAVTAQTRNLEPVSIKAPSSERLMEAPASITAAVPNGQITDQNQKSGSNLNVNFVELGSAGNAYTTFGNGRTYLWADPMLNSVVYTHRMTGGVEVEGNSRIAYDFSSDGGATFTNDNQVYTPTGPDPGTGYPMDAGRYPQGGILNPAGNTDLANANYTYFIPTLNGDNNNWGGYAFGSAPLGTDNSSQVNWGSSGDTWRLIPNAFHITQQGVAWYVDGSDKDEAGAYVYTGELILGRGEMAGDAIDYTETLLSFLEAGESIGDLKIAFAPDGMTGYIVAIAENTSNLVDYTSFHPILLKTEDGGVSWSDPIDVQLGGEDGIESIKNYLPDSIITLVDFYADWSGDRDELYFNFGFHVDLAVDAMGNPYLIGMVSLADDADSWYPGLGTEWAIHSTDGAETWDADDLADQWWFDGLLGDLNTYNRPQVSIDYEGTHLFYSWLDSQADAAEENDRPNIYLTGYDIENDAYTEVIDVTYFTQAWNKAFFGSQSYYVFQLSPESFKVPFTYTEFETPDVPTDPVKYWYLDYVLSFSQEYNLAFTVTNMSDEAIEDAVVTVEGYSSVDTDADGKASLLVTNGNYNYTVAAEGYTDASGDVTVDGADASVTVKMEMVVENYSVTFNVTDLSGPVAGATVSLAGFDDMQTDASGMATFAEVADGDYDYSVSKADFLTASGSVTVAGENATVNVEMEVDGINEQLAARIEVYPNPANSIVYINNLDKADVLVYNLTGQLVVNLEQVSGKQSIDISDLKNGVYIIKVHEGAAFMARRLNIVH